MPDIIVKVEDFAPVVREVISSIYNSANSVVIDFCGLVFTLWDVFIAGMVLTLLGIIAYAFTD